MRVGPPALLVLAVGMLAFTATAARAAQPVLQGSFDGSGTPAKSMLPTRMAVDETSGSVYVLDPNDEVVNVFDASGHYQSQLIGSATPAGTFDLAGTANDDIAVDNSPGGTRNVYVVGEDGGGPEEITAFDDTGRLLWQTALPSGSETCGVSVDHTGHLWTADFNAGLQQRSTADGSTIGSPILIPGGDCHFAIDSAGDFFLILFSSGSLHEFNSTGTEIGPNPIDPSGDKAVAIDSFNGDVYVAHNTSAAGFDASGNAIGSPFATTQLTRSVGIAVNGVNHKIYLSDKPSASVYIFDEVDALTVTPAGTGSGSVSADSGAIRNCSATGGACSDNYGPGTAVTLTPTPAAGSTFAGWSGGGCSGTGTCQVTLSADTMVTATFTPIPKHTLKVTSAGTGAGSVTSAPTGIDCGTACSQQFQEGHVVLTAKPATGSTFTGWSGGGCSGTSTCDVDLTADTTVAATFTTKPAPTCATDASLCPPPPTCATNPSLCPPPPPPPPTPTCATNAALCVTSPLPTCATNASLCPPNTMPTLPSQASILGSTARIVLHCGAGGGGCSGALTLIARVKIKHGRHWVARTIVVGGLRYQIAAGSAASVKVKLSAAALSALAHGSLTATAKGVHGSIKLPRLMSRKR